MKKIFSSEQARQESQLRIMRHKEETPQEYLDFALAEIISLTGSKVALLNLYNEFNREFKLQNIVSTRNAALGGNNRQIWSSADTARLWTKALKQARPVALKEKEIPASLKRIGILLKRFLAIPLFSGGDIVAVAGFADKARPYTQKDIRHAFLLMNLAWQTAQKMWLEKNQISTGPLFNDLKKAFSIGFFWKNTDLKYQGCNEYFAALAGLPSPDDIQGKTDNDLAWHNQAESFRAFDEEVLKTGSVSIKYGQFVEKADKTPLWLNISGIPVKDAKGNILAIVGTANDITSRKQDEIKNLRLAAIVESTDDAIVAMDSDGIITDWNRAAEKLYGYTRREAIGMPVANLAPPGFEAEVSDIIATLRDNHRPASYETKRKRKNGQIFDVAITAAPIFYPDGSFAGISSIGRDITEKNRQIKELELYREFLENIEDGCFELDLKGNVTYTNPATAFMFGIDRELAMGASYTQYTSPQEAKKLFSIFNQIYKTGKRNFIEEMEIIRKDGLIQYFDLEASPMFETSGQISGFRCTIRNVTQKKQQREELERYRDFVLNVDDACFEYDFDGNVLFCNEPVFQMLGYTRDEYMKLSHLERHPDKEAADHSAAIIKKLYATGQPSGLCEVNLLRKDGSVITVEMNANIIRDQQGNPIGWRGTGRDVTARKQRQAELERYRDFLENIYDGCFEIDLRGKITYINEAGARGLGFSKEEFTGMHNLQYTSEQEAKRITKIFRKIYDTGQPSLIDHYELLHKDGHPIFMEMSTALIRDDKGRPTGFRGVARDVTEKKKNEELLQASEAKYRFLTEKISDVVWTTDINLVFNYITPSIDFTLGYQPEELIGRTPEAIMTPDAFRDAILLLAEKISKSHEILLDDSRFVEFETTLLNKQGDTLWFSHVVSFIRDKKGEATGIHGVSRNITEQKQAQKEKEKLIFELQEALSEVKTLSGLLPICSHCKKIRDDRGYWNQLETYLLDHSNALLSHSICPECAEKYYPDILKPKKPG
ncbi:MAG TPA: PAS domain S-box protein [Smithellaceae bacterium]|jgi:PAS domain S-box-containing protein|nr:PAS domain S-box protein [Smithellaceae bacterium]